MLDATDQSFRKNEDLIDSLITQAFIFFMEFKLNLGGPENALTPVDLLSEYGRSDPEHRTFYAFKINDDERDTPKRKVILKYNLLGGIRTAVTIHQWIDILSSGTVDAQRFNAELAGAPEVTGPKNWPSWKRLWHIWSWDFSEVSCLDFENDVSDVLSGIEDGRNQDPLIVMHIVGFCLLLLDEGLIDDIEDGWVQRFRTYIDKVVVLKLDMKRYSSTRWRFDSGYETPGYIRKGEEDFEQVLSHLQNAVNYWYINWKKIPQQSV